MARTVLYLNDVDPWALGLEVDRLTDWASAVPRKRPTRPRYGRPGEFAVGATQLDAREMQVDGTVLGADRATMLARMDTLKARLTGTVRVRFVDRADREYLCELASLEVGWYTLALLQSVAQVTMRLRAADPWARAVSDTVVNVTTSATACALGTAPSRPVIVVTGPVTNPTITYAAAGGGAILTTLTVNVTLGASDTLTVDCDALTITKTVASVTTDALNALASGDFPVLDPADGDYGAASWPTLKVSGGSAVATYRKRWE